MSRSTHIIVVVLAMALSASIAHADRDELFGWISGLKKAPRRVFVTHGEAESAQSFGKFLHEKTGWKISVPEYGTEVFLS